MVELPERVHADIERLPALGDFAAGRDNLANAMRCPGAIGSAFLHLRLGQCHLERW